MALEIYPKSRELATVVLSIDLQHLAQFSHAHSCLFVSHHSQPRHMVLGTFSSEHSRYALHPMTEILALWSRGCSGCKGVICARKQQHPARHVRPPNAGAVFCATNTK